MGNKTEVRELWYRMQLKEQAKNWILFEMPQQSIEVFKQGD